MKIEIEYQGGTCYWKNKVTASALYAAAILSTPDFLQRVALHPSFDFTDKSSLQVAGVIKTTEVAKIKVGFYYKWWFTKAIAYEQDGAVYFNTAKEGYGAGDWPNVMHELLHSLGFQHNGNSPSGQQNTVPWKVVELAKTWLAEGGKIAS